MYAWESIQKSIEFIEEHLSEEINITQVASLCGLSKFYYQRLFHRLVSKNVGEYIKLRRLAKGIALLKGSNASILEIALQCGFQSHSSFTKAFKDVYDLTPDYYRHHDLVLDYFLKPELIMKYTQIDIDVPLICENMVLEIHKRSVIDEGLFIGKSMLANTIEIAQPKINPLIDIWREIEKDENLLPYIMRDKGGIDVLTQGSEADKFQYFVGLQANEEVDGYESWLMPKGNYIVCEYEAENFDKLVSEALYKASSYVFEVWLPTHNIQTEGFLVQKYFNPRSESCYIELWVKIKDNG